MGMTPKSETAMETQHLGRDAEGDAEGDVEAEAEGDVEAEAVTTTAMLDIAEASRSSKSRRELFPDISTQFRCWCSAQAQVQVAINHS